MRKVDVKHHRSRHILEFQIVVLCQAVFTGESGTFNCTTGKICPLCDAMFGGVLELGTHLIGYHDVLFDMEVFNSPVFN